jgi:ketosteroid isomerase-like protein
MEYTNIMKSLKLTFAALLIMVASLAFGQGKIAKEDLKNTNDSTAIRKMINSYCRSIDLADTSLARTIWSTRDSISFIHPLGHEHGWAQIKNHFILTIMGQTFSKRDLQVVSISIHQLTPTIAWLEFYWDFHATFRSNNQALETKGRETQLLEKENGQWRIIHVHYSGLPVTEKEKGF